MVWIISACPVAVHVAVGLLEQEPVVLAVPDRRVSAARAAVIGLLGRGAAEKLDVWPEEVARSGACSGIDSPREIWRLSCLAENDDATTVLWADVARGLGTPFRLFYLDPVAETPIEALPGPFSVFMHALHQTVDEVRSRDAGYFDRKALRTTLPADFASLDASSAACTIVAASSGPPFECRIAPDSVDRPLFSDAISDAYELELVMGAQSSTLTAVDRLFESRLCRIVDWADATRGVTRRARTVGGPELKSVVKDWHRCHTESLRAERSRLVALPASAAVSSSSGEPAFHIFGERGPTIVIVNAIAQDDRYWVRLIDRLANEHRVVTWTQRTWGKEGDAASFADHVNDLNAVINSVADEPVHLMGWCTGPKLCTKYCLSHPRQISSMIFLAGTYRPFGDARFDTDYEVALEMVFKLLDQSPRAAAMVRTTLLNALGGGRFNAATPDDLGAEVLARIDPALLTSVSAPYTDDQSTLRYAGQIREFWNYSIEQDVKGIQIPVIVVGAELDRVASPHLALRVAQAIPHAQYIRLPGATHYCMYDRPDDIASIIRRFLHDPYGAFPAASEVPA